jgi:phage regulator Rha-like protein
MAKRIPSLAIPLEVVERLIYVVRGQRVMFDADLAWLYGVPTKALNKAVQRNLPRFPRDFMFRLTRQEVTNLRFQIGTSSSGHGGRRYLPYAFTEQGVTMLSSALNSERAVQVNIAVIRTFVHLRQMLASNRTLAAKLAELERQVTGHDAAIQNLFAAIRAMLAVPPGPKCLIGFNREKEKP